MNQPPGAAPSAALSKPDATKPPPKRRVKRDTDIFKSVNNRRQKIGNKPLDHTREPPKTNGVKPARAASPPKAPPSVQQVSGFSDPRVFSENIPFKDYKIVTTKRELLQGLRYHLLHQAYSEPIDIRNGELFHKPAHLHRRDPRYKAKPPSKEEPEEPKDGMTPELRAEMTRRKEQRQKQREENLAQVAPSLSTGKRISNKKKTAQVNQSNLSEDQKRLIQTTYEEKLPWHLEDWDSKKVLVGQHQVGPARMYAAFAFEPSTNRFRMIPVEKVYNFEPKKEEPKNLQPELTLEELEAVMKRKKALPDILARHEEAKMRERQKEVEARRAKGLFTGGGRGIDASRGGEDADLDFDDDFADDEEGDIFEEDDEDKKVTEKKIKEDQLQANFLDFKDVRDYDILDQREEREKEYVKHNYKDVRKALARREGNYNQGSDSGGDDSTDTDEERERLEAEKLANVRKDEDTADGKTSRVPSGANTPSGRKEKTASDREGKKARPPKRPGSPNLSDASGTDASVARKKKKTKHTPSSQPTPNPSRPISPDNANLDPASAGNRIPRSSSLHLKEQAPIPTVVLCPMVRRDASNSKSPMQATRWTQRLYPHLPRVLPLPHQCRKRLQQNSCYRSFPREVFQPRN